MFAPCRFIHYYILYTRYFTRRRMVNTQARQAQYSGIVLTCGINVGIRRGNQLPQGSLVKAILSAQLQHKAFHLLESALVQACYFPYLHI